MAATKRFLTRNMTLNLILLSAVLELQQLKKSQCTSLHCADIFVSILVCELPNLVQLYQIIRCKFDQLFLNNICPNRYCTNNVDLLLLIPPSNTCGRHKNIAVFSVCLILSCCHAYLYITSIVEGSGDSSRHINRYTARQPQNLRASSDGLVAIAVLCHCPLSLTKEQRCIINESCHFVQYTRRSV